MRFIRFPILITLCAALPVTALAARAAEKWPPLNAIEERYSEPVQVGNAIFTTGYYSWYVPSYSVPSLHYSETVNTGPREWWMMVGLGGNEPIGPRTGGGRPSAPGTVRVAAGGTLPDLAPLPALPTAVTALPGVPSLPGIPGLNTLPPLQSLSP
jgi:hypothetical protein